MPTPGADRTAQHAVIARLAWLGYELVRYGARGVTRWTWRRPKAAMAEWYVRLGEQLKRRDNGAVADILAEIARQPGFHGVRPFNNLV